jgi:hypothetical protein
MNLSRRPMMRGERWRTGWFFVVAFAVLYAGVAGAARVVPAGGKPTAAPAGATGVSRVQTIDNQRRVDVNQLNMFVTNFGSFAFDLATGNAGLYFPKGVNKTAIFAGGLWIGALVGGQPYATIAEFGQEYVPGPMLGTSFSPDSPNYKVYKVARYRGNAADTAHVERTAEELAADPTADRLVHHSWSEYVLGAGPSGAPTEVVRLPVTITSDPVDSMDVVAPRVLGDQMLWCIYNDADPSKHEENAGGTPPLGLEIEQAVFGFDFTGSLGQAVFIRYVIRNKGGNTLDDMYLALWADPDLGGFTDDLVGCDVPLSLGYCYNATNTDQLYGRAPPAVGYDFLQGPLDILGAELGLTSFNKYINGTDPSAPDESYNYMQGLLPDGTDVVDPTNGQVTKFFHPGDPATRVGWLDSNPADRRYMMSSGPFRMAPGDTQVVVGAVLIGQGSDRLSSSSPSTRASSSRALRPSRWWTSQWTTERSTCAGTRARASITTSRATRSRATSSIRASRWPVRGGGSGYSTRSTASPRSGTRCSTSRPDARSPTSRSPSGPTPACASAIRRPRTRSGVAISRTEPSTSSP